MKFSIERMQRPCHATCYAFLLLYPMYQRRCALRLMPCKISHIVTQYTRCVCVLLYQQKRGEVLGALDVSMH